MPLSINETRLVLIPKVASPNTVVDFRPIPCCNTIYKTISNLLCNRLRVVLPSVINQSQGAFVDGRELLFNVLLCQEIARGYSRKLISPRCMMKIDLRKAYDSIHWGCVKEILDALNFPPLFIKWVLACITTPTFTIQLNGGEYRKFHGREG